MLHRHDSSDLVVITQPSHAWISGQLASSWGNVDGGFEQPRPELKIAADQHDIAWLDWESKPTLNQATGLPHTFSELPTLEHVRVWSTATSRALSYGRLSALLISMHGTYLYERFHDFDSDTAEEVRAARAFLRREAEFQERTIAQLTDHGDISHSDIYRQRQLLSTWDAMSLALCMDFEETRVFSGVPTLDGERELSLRRLTSTGEAFTIDPWPFARNQVDLFCEGRLLEGRFSDEAEMRAAIMSAPSVPIRFSLTPAP